VDRITRRTLKQLELQKLKLEQQCIEVLLKTIKKDKKKLKEKY
jgi:hypothetical protein